MAQKPALLVENFFNESQFPDHVISASTETSGYEAWRVGTGRRPGRAGARDKWLGTTVASDEWVKVVCGQLRAADMLVIDREHNLDAIKLQGSTDDFATTPTDVIDIATFPTSEGGALDDATGAVTEEGAWLIRFTEASYSEWRILVPTGNSANPEIPNIWLGSSYTLGHLLDLPYDDYGDELIYNNIISSTGWMAMSGPAQVRRGELEVKMETTSEWANDARYHLQQLYGAGHEMWITFDPDDAARAVCAIRPPGRMAFTIRKGWGYRQASVPWYEHEAKYIT